MIKNKIKKYFYLLFILPILILTACSNNKDSTNNLGEKEIEIPYKPNNSIVRSTVISEVLKDVGYEVITTPVASSGPMYAITSKSSDAFNTDGIFPSTDKSYLKKYHNLKIYDTKNLIDKINISLVVPKYMNNINSINDLKSNKEIGKSVDWTITGIDNRNGIINDTKKALQNDDFDKWKINTLSNEEMFSKLQNKYRNKEPIIFTSEQSSWLFKEMNLKSLKDRDKIYGDNEHINLVFNKNFKNEHPAAYTIVTRIADDWSEKEENELSKKIYFYKEDPQKVVEDYLNKNESKENKWIKGIN